MVIESGFVLTGLDLAVRRIQTALNVSFPTYQIYGVSQRLTKVIDNKNFRYPAFRHATRDYINLLPSDTSNYMFFERLEYEKVIEHPYLVIEAKVSLIVWLRLPNNQSKEEIKMQIVRILVNQPFYTLNEILDFDIFKSYDYEEINQQYMMHPYVGFKFTGILKYDNSLPC